jgi:hypothetical protein
MTRHTTTRSFCATCFSGATDRAGTVHRLAARTRKVMSNSSPSSEGDGAPKSANLWFRICRQMRRALLGTPIADVLSAPGPAFRRRHRREWPAGVSACSRRGLLVAPEGAPMPPDARVAYMSPQAPHLVPLHERLMIAPSSGRGACSVSAPWSAGISLRLKLRHARHWAGIHDLTALPPANRG